MKINEIFLSINGEVTAAHQGRLAVFIRMAGCNLVESFSVRRDSRPCSYCDTPNAQYLYQGKELRIAAILKEVKKQAKGTRYVTITGGEPLLQKEDLQKLVVELSLLGFLVTLETNGTLDIPQWGRAVHSWVADWKLPSSGVSELASLGNIKTILKNQDNRNFLKFVIQDRKDFVAARNVITEVNGYINIALSPNLNVLSPRVLLNWIKQVETKNWSPILNLQLHKIIDVK